MTDKQHPIAPPAELIYQWIEEYRGVADGSIGIKKYILIQIDSYRAGADAELEACCKLLDSCTVIPVDGYANTAQNILAAVDRVARLRAARRPSPPSLKEQAYDALDTYIYGEPDPNDKERTYNTIRKALEQLDD